MRTNYILRTIHVKHFSQLFRKYLVQLLSKMQPLGLSAWGRIMGEYLGCLAVLKDAEPARLNVAEKERSIVFSQKNTVLKL
jgi:hypothetical protein